MKTLRKPIVRIITILVASLAVAGLAYEWSAGTALAAAHEAHPHIRSAIHELREARRELKEADHDFGGHRVAALAATDEAIKQLQMALKFDRH